MRNNEIYEGGFYNDQMHGWGVYKWSNGTIYTGNYINELKEGYGELYFKDESFLKGCFDKGKPFSKMQYFSHESGALELMFESSKELNYGMDKQITIPREMKVETCFF